MNDQLNADESVCSECDHPCSYHTAAGCGIEECGCSETMDRDEGREDSEEDAWVRIAAQNAADANAREAALQANLAALRAVHAHLREQVQALIDKWNDFAFSGDEHYVPQGDGYIASTCADELEAALAASSAPLSTESTHG